MKFEYKGNRVFYDHQEIFETKSEIEKLLEVHSTCIVLYGLDKELVGKAQANIVCIDSSGKVIWTIAPAPVGGHGRTDNYTALFWEEGKLKVFSGSCFLYTLNPDTGELSDEVFTK